MLRENVIYLSGYCKVVLYPPPPITKTVTQVFPVKIVPEHPLLLF